MSNGKTIKDYEDFKSLTPDQQNYHIYIEVSKISELHKKFALKWVEQMAKGGLIIILSATLISAINLVIIKN